jgi:hypothetical protein
MTSESIQSPVSTLLLTLLQVRERGGLEPQTGSPADREMKTFARPESVATAFSQGLVATEAAADHLHALDLLIAAHDSALAPWTCARGLLEASATATWLLDTRIDAGERVGRSMALRYATLREQRKLAEGDGNFTAAAQIDQRIDEIDAIAAQLGYPPVNDKKGRRISIDHYKPSITDLVDQQFDLEKVYRIFSGVAHCDIVTASQLGFKMLEPSPSGGLVKRLAVNRDLQRLLLANAVAVYARPVWLEIVQYGRDITAAARALEEAYHACGLDDRSDIRFWRSK